MNENEQIQEIEKILITGCGNTSAEDCEVMSCHRCRAKTLCNANYRKVERGEWIEHTEIGAMNNYWECSVCRWKTVSFTEMRHSNFCPHCGADMRKEDEGK